MPVMLCLTRMCHALEVVVLIFEANSSVVQNDHCGGVDDGYMPRRGDGGDSDCPGNVSPVWLMSPSADLPICSERAMAFMVFL